MRKGSASRANTIRRAGVRVTHGPWVLYIAPKSQPTRSRLIVALGRRAGGAVTRSRIRRIARDSFRTFRSTDSIFDALLLARGDVALQPRRSVRKVLYGLLERGKGALSKPDTSGGGARE
jgi:ribonuclease P protein component